MSILYRDLTNYIGDEPILQSSYSASRDSAVSMSLEKFKRNISFPQPGWWIPHKQRHRLNQTDFVTFIPTHER